MSYYLNTFWNIFEKFESINKEVEEERVLILTDLDKKGKELYGKLKAGLSRRGVKVDDKLRDFLFRNSKIKQIEGLRKIQV